MSKWEKEFDKLADREECKQFIYDLRKHDEEEILKIVDLLENRILIEKYYKE
jgi:hypothetical protein